MKTLIIAEKPSVARDIAAALGGFTKQGDWLERDDAIVSSAVGHLVQLSGPGWEGRGFDGLPAIPPAFELQAIPSTEAQLRLLQRLMARPDVGTVVNACDAGREGELIFRLIYEYAQCRKPMKRMWLQSMTAGAIREANSSLKAGAQFDALGAAARCRSEADWLVGINGSRGMTAMGEILTGQRQMRSVGRVQTPTLAILVHREDEIAKFVPKPYWEVHAAFGVAAGDYQGRWCSAPSSREMLEDVGAVAENEDSAGSRIWDKAHADAILRKCEGVAPTSVEDVAKRVTQAAPRLFDLTTLQREANKRFKFSAKKTLDLAQALYERHKAVTYPRTDSSALPEDYIPKTKDTLEALANAGGAHAAHARRVLDQSWVRPDKRVFNNAKISDHFAIIPTGRVPGDLDVAEAKIYDLVVRRFLAAFHPAAQYDSTVRLTVVAGELFKAHGRVLAEAGWLVVYGQDADDAASKPPALCAVVSGEVPRTRDVQLKSLKTKAPSRYTESSLLSAMEAAGKLVDDEELREAMKERGLGTPATRASIIETLLASKDRKGNSIEPYVAREGKDQLLVPTRKGMELVQFLEAQGLTLLTSPAMTGEWEARLGAIEKGAADAQVFIAQIRAFTSRMIEMLKQRAAAAPEAQAVPLGAPCPKCHELMQSAARGFSCRCGYSLARVVAGRTVSDDEAKVLFSEGKTELMQGFFSKAKGKSFAAVLKVGVEGKIEFDFPARAPASVGAKRFPCPRCSKPLMQRTSARGAFWGCSGYPGCTYSAPDVAGVPGTREADVGVSMSAGEVSRIAAARGAAQAPRKQGNTCPSCGKGKLARKPGREGGFFLGCSSFPNCRHFQWDTK